MSIVVTNSVENSAEPVPAGQNVGADGSTTPMSPQAFAAACKDIVGSMCGHAAHRALDLLTNDVLNSLGYSDGILIFEAAVTRWHGEADQYPYAGPCPDCE